MKKLSGFIFTLLIISIFINVYGANESTDTQTVKASDTCILREKTGDFSAKKTEKIKFIIKEEFNKLYEEKSKKKDIEEIAVLNQKLEEEKKRCERYKHKLKSRKNYISPKDSQNEIDRVKLNLVLEFNRYLQDYISKSENKDKKVKQLDLDKIFSHLINFNFTFNNPNEVNISPSLIKGEAKASVVGAGIAV